MDQAVYSELARHLDGLPGGFPPSRSGAHLRVLQRLFSPEEAALATKLTLSRETAGAVAVRAGLEAREAEQQLETMAQKGLVFSVRQADGRILYQAAPWVVGIYEFQVNNLSRELLAELAEYRRTVVRRPPEQALPQMRVIPVASRVEIHPVALPYEVADMLVEAHTRYAVVPCICRRKARMEGGGCDAADETCLNFGDMADFVVRTGRGRVADREEIKSLIRKAEASSLVLQPSNSKRVEFICCCCGCCCGVLQGLKAHPNPSEIVESPFIAELSAAECTGCFSCVERCQMDALARSGEVVSLDATRCIGCGLCASACEAHAIRLVRRQRPGEARVPEDISALWQTIARAQGRAR